MQIKKGLRLRQLSDKMYILEPVSGAVLEYNNQIVTFNSTSAFLWQAILDSEFDEYKLAELLVSKYDVDYKSALQDCIEIIRQWKSAGLIHY